MNIEKARTGDGTKPRQENRGNIKILIYRKTKDGLFERRQTGSLTKVLAVLRKPFAAVRIKCVFAWGDNEGSYASQEAAARFVKHNWEDWREWRGL